MKYKNITSGGIMLWAFCLTLYIYQYAIRSAIPNVLNNELISYFSTDAQHFGKILSLFYFTYTIMQIPIGLIADRISLNRLCYFALMCVGIGIILFVSTKTLLVAYLSQFLLGIGCSFGFILLLKTTHDTFPKDKVTFVTSIVISMGCAGPALLGIFLSYIIQFYFWKNVVMYIGYMGLILSVMCIIQTEILGKILPRPKESSYSLLSSLSKVVKTPQFWFIGLFSTTNLTPIIAFSDVWGISFLKSVYNLNSVQAAVVNNVIYVGIVCGGPFMGFISQKIKSYKLPMIFGTISMLFILSLIIFIKLHFILLCFLLFLLGFTSACQLLSFPAALSSTEKQLSATVSGFVNTLTMIGGAIIMPLIGKIIDHSCISRGACICDRTAIDYIMGMVPLIGSLCLALVFLYFIKDININSTNK